MAVKKNKVSQEEINTNKVMFAIMLSFLGETVLFFMYRSLYSGTGVAKYIQTGWKYSVSFGAIIFVAALVWFILWKIGKYESKALSWTPFNWLCTATIGFALFGIMKIASIFDKGNDPSKAIKYLAVALAVFIILYIIFYFNRRAFFTFSVLSTVFGTLIYLFYHLNKKWDVSLYIISAIVAILAVLFIITCKANKGELVIGKKSIKFFSSKSKYYFHFALIVIFIAAVIAFIIYGKTAALYSLYSIIGIEIIVSIYTTYKVI